MPKLKIKKGDKVVVITGRDKGKTGEVLRVFPSENRARRAGRQHGQAPHPAEAWASPAASSRRS